MQGFLINVNTRGAEKIKIDASCSLLNMNIRIPCFCRNGKFPLAKKQLAVGFNQLQFATTLSLTVEFCALALISF